MPAAISFQNVSKSYATPRGELQALQGVGFDIEPGEFFGLLGPNGAGKTTLISILAGLARASSGRVLVHGMDVVADFAAARRQLGVVPQELVFDPFFNVRETLRIQSGYFGIKANEAWIDELLEGLGLADKAGSNMRQLSGGMKRRVLVAQALVHKPPVIVLDEPTAGVDVELRQTLWQFVSQLNRTQGSTVLLTTHYLEGHAQEGSGGGAGEDLRTAQARLVQRVALQDRPGPAGRSRCHGPCHRPRGSAARAQRAGGGAPAGPGP